MSKRERARAQIGSLLDPSEKVTVLAQAQIKGPGSVSSTPAAWVVVTDSRLLLFSDGRRSALGELVFEAWRHEVSAVLESGIFHQVVVHDPAVGQTVARLSFGRSRSDAAAVVSAVSTQTPGTDTAPVVAHSAVASLRPGERLPDGTVLSAVEWLRAFQEESDRYR